MTKSSISFGLVHIPVVLKLAVRSKDIGFNMIDRKTKSRVQYQKTCVDCDGRIVEQSDIIKGYQHQKGEYVFFEDSDFEKLKTKKDKTIAIEKFVGLGEIDPIFFEKPYYVVPDKSAARAFALLFAAMEKEKKVGIARTVIGTKENLVALRAVGDAMILSTMFFDDEVEQVPAIVREKIDSNEMALAKTIINNMTAKFDPKDYKDEYREKVLLAINSKIKGKKITSTPEEKPIRVVNLMDALKRTLEAV
jgi:DNA end-binding protein Ku